MKLSKQDAKLYFELTDALQFFVSQQFNIYKNIKSNHNSTDQPRLYIFTDSYLKSLECVFKAFLSLFLYRTT